MVVYYYGAHLSIDSKRGLLGTIENAQRLGCTAVQVFLSGNIRVISDNVVNKYTAQAPEIRQALKHANMKLLIHSPYILNFGKDPHDGDAYWVDALFKELRVAHLIGAEGCVIHVGKHVKLDRNTSEDYMYQSILQVIALMRKHNLSSKIFLETAAGQGTELIPTFDEFARFLERFDDDDRNYIRACIDTCHVFAAGVDLSTPLSARQFVSHVDKKLGWHNVGVIHLNNSEQGMFSRKDRHANLQHGRIPFDALKEIVDCVKHRKIPLILETPSCDREVGLLDSMVHNTTYDESSYFLRVLNTQ